MEDFEIVDLMETLEDVGLETQDAFVVVGTKVPVERRTIIMVTHEGTYSYWMDDEEQEQREYPVYKTEDSEYQVDFKQQFQEHFSHKIKEMGESYFFLDTSESRVPSFTIWGNSSGIIKLKEEVKMKFPAAEILEVKEHEYKNNF